MNLTPKDLSFLNSAVGKGAMHIRVESRPDALTFRTGDWKSWRIVSIPTPGPDASTTLRYREFALASRTAGKDAILTVSLKAVEFAQPDAAWRVDREDSDVEIAPPPDDPTVWQAELDAEHFSALFNHTAPIAPAYNRYGLTGVKLEATESGTRAVVTDGNRLHYVDLDMSITAPPLGLWPGDILCAMADVKAGAAVVATITQHATGARNLILSTVKEGVTYTVGARLSYTPAKDGKPESDEFPDYRQVIPATFGGGSLTFDRDVFAKACAKVLPFSGKQAEGVLTVAPGTVTISSLLDTAKVTIPCGVSGNVSPRQGFSPAFLRTAALAQPPGPMVIEFSAQTLGLCRVRSLVSPAAASILMPQRID